MKWVAEISHAKAARLEIEQKEDGFFLYVFEKDGCINDYWQETLEFAMEQAEYSFGIPPSAWRQNP